MEEWNGAADRRSIEKGVDPLDVLGSSMSMSTPPINASVHRVQCQLLDDFLLNSQVPRSPWKLKRNEISRRTAHRIRSTSHTFPRHTNRIRIRPIDLPTIWPESNLFAIEHFQNYSCFSISFDFVKQNKKIVIQFIFENQEECNKYCNFIFINY